MRTLLSILSLFTLAELAAAAPVPKEILKRFPDYYPLLPGTEWVYETPGGGAEVTLRVKDYENRDGVRTGVLASYVGDSEVATEGIRVDPTGVYRTHLNGSKIEPPLLLLKFGIKDETEWSTDCEILKAKIVFKFKLEGLEEITVPAGKYSAVKVSGTGTVSDTETRMTNHYVDGVGMVRLVLSYGETKHELGLKKFTPGKEEKK